MISHSEMRLSFNGKTFSHLKGGSILRGCFWKGTFGITKICLGDHRWAISCEHTPFMFADSRGECYLFVCF